MKKDNIMREGSFEFALKIIELYRQMIEQKEFVLSKQILRSGTSIGANIEVASAGYSKKDYAAKISTASKEARETRYWLRSIDKSQIAKANVKKYLDEIEPGVNILTAIVKSPQAN
ncbi:MAG: four helix bundle protein [Bacteroidetes bacterium]|nr:four helix bundle protein [Bacteroidota bacterium]MBU1579120.1 four helix bundle protein [Bacteroidota bacterium]MBU2465120.1 four helix bundle protein [Bacteroidota bacterium]MBU2556748.1 four helix bundle protein [Bacteroidota bacterium]